MGTWGHGNFDDDTAADHLSDLTGRLMKEIATAVEDPGEIQPDDYWGCAVPCRIEILNVVAKQRWVGMKLPKPDVAEKWKTDFLSVWDEYIDKLKPQFDELTANAHHEHDGR
jgi:hypothetical protein